MERKRESFTERKSKVVKLIKEKGISTLGQLKNEDISLYNFVQVNRLASELGLEKWKRSPKWDLGKIMKLVEENGIETMPELRKHDKSAYNYIVTNRLTDKLGLRRRAKNVKGRQRIELVWPYLAKWAIKEGTTMREQAYSLGYYTQYNEWVVCNSEPVPEMFIKNVHK